MAGSSPGLAKAFKAEAAITRRRIIKHGATDTGALMAAASTDLLIGISAEIDVALAENVDVFLEDIAEVEYGGVVTRGQKLTSDALARAVAAAPAAGVNAHCIGIAMVSGVLGDVGSVLIAPSVMQG